ncbi:OsmC family protein [Aquimarina macrocephali]|uniref:OsmC family protein n=1 Tax=Aquimarina macrocephali TaxID=666563 RepID=UPI000465B49E|nr:OsmC family protein [Aquimarina macrocephali]
MKHSARVFWKKNQHEAFMDGKYSRAHAWYFDGGAEILASSSPEVVPTPMSNASAVDPEEAFLASVSSCHMLFFLSIASKKKYVVESYEDHPVGELNEIKGKKAITTIALCPKVIFKGNQPSIKNIEQMHNLAHSNCFIANSIIANIQIKII